MPSQKREPSPPGVIENFPVLPLRDIVVFPHMIVPLFVGREKSIRALEEVMKADKLILLATQMNATDDDPAVDSIYQTGTLASVLQLLKLPDGTVKVLVEGQARAKVHDYTNTDDFYEADAETIADDTVDEVEVEALARSVVSRVRRLCEAQQEDLARGRLRRHPDRGLFEARRHGRLASRGQDRRQAGRARDDLHRQAAGEVPVPDGERNQRSFRSRSASARASSARWRRRSASTTSTSR